MTWSLRVLWLTVCVATVVLPVPANAEDLLYSCYAGSMLDDITRGFYIENFSGSTLDRVAIDYMTSGEPGTYRTSLTAHQGTYDGPVIAWADNSFSETGAAVRLRLLERPDRAVHDHRLRAGARQRPAGGRRLLQRGPLRCGRCGVLELPRDHRD